MSQVKAKEQAKNHHLTDNPKGKRLPGAKEILSCMED